MDDIIRRMVESSPHYGHEDPRNSIRQMLQETTLYALSESGFFQMASFYGGTCLRMFHGLDRFSEDLDFSLRAPNPDFTFDAFIPDLEKTMTGFGLDVVISERKKTKDSTIRSAFLKGNTKMLMLDFFPDAPYPPVDRNENIRVKFEVDTDPPEHAGFEKRFGFRPYPYEVSCYDLPSLFAGKIHAILCRKWKDRVKGRDLFDYLFYVGRNVPVNLAHLQSRLVQTGCVDPGSPLDPDTIAEMLHSRFSELDYTLAKDDVTPFVTDPRSLGPWCTEMFDDATGRLGWVRCGRRPEKREKEIAGGDDPSKGLTVTPRTGPRHR